MNLIALAEKLAGGEQAPATFAVGRCLYSGDKFSRCTACFDVCPAGAIEPGQPPEFDAAACHGCLACLPVCPTGAYAMEDELSDLLRCLTRLSIDTLELVCQHHPAPTIGLSMGAAAIQVRGCLAGLGAASYLQLATRPIRRVVARTDACDGCPWHSLQEAVRKQIAEAQQWLSVWQRADFVEELAELRNGVKRPVHRADTPPVSRRDLFRGRVQEPPPVDVTSSLHPFHRRLRTLSALRQLADDNRDPGAIWPPASALADSSFATLSISEACSACGTCVRACPSGALTLEKDDDKQRFQLSCSVQACLACDACAHICPEQAITVNHEAAAEQILAASPETTLYEDALAKCSRCTGYFAARSMQDGLCSVCAFRRKNPFISRMPPHLAALDASGLSQAAASGDNR